VILHFYSRRISISHIVEIQSKLRDPVAVAAACRSFLQAYSVEKARLEARRAGHAVTEQALADGSIKLTIQTA